jgi:hypothetical protein
MIGEKFPELRSDPLESSLLFFELFGFGVGDVLGEGSDGEERSQYDFPPNDLSTGRRNEPW